MPNLPSYGRCTMCGEIFQRRNENKLYCSRKCRQAALRESCEHPPGKAAGPGDTPPGRQLSFLDDLPDEPAEDTWLLRRLDRRG